MKASESNGGGMWRASWRGISIWRQRGGAAKLSVIAS